MHMPCQRLWKTRSVQLARFIDCDLGSGYYRMGAAHVGVRADRGFRVGFIGHDGIEQRLPIAAVAEYRFEDTAPVRSFPSFRGQRNNTGWWCARPPVATSDLSPGSNATTSSGWTSLRMQSACRLNRSG